MSARTRGRSGWLLMIAAAAAVTTLLGPAPQAQAGTADVIVVVDESGSMAGEHAWISTMIGQLDTALAAQGITGRYGLVGFGGGTTHYAGHKHTVGGGEFGTAAQFSAATSGLVLSGGTEDGWSGIDTALSYSFAPAAGINIILVTDEDRDNINNTLSYANILNSLTTKKAILNSVVNASFRNAANVTALGVDYEANAYKADGLGGYTETTGGYVYSAYGTTKANYIDLAWATGGAGWDLNQLRAGGLTAQSFTDAFIDIKVAEIQDQVIPLPAALWAGLALLGGVSFHQRLRRRSPA